MLALALLWAKEKMLPWILLHWKDACVGLLVVLVCLFWRTSGQLSQCQASLAAKPSISQAQASTATAKAFGTIVAKPGPARPCPAAGICPPCPEFEVHFGSEAFASQAQSQTAGVAPDKVEPGLKIWLGASAVGANQKIYPLMTTDLEYKRFKINAGMGFESWQAGASWCLKF